MCLKTVWFVLGVCKKLNFIKMVGGGYGLSEIQEPCTYTSFALLSAALSVHIIFLI